MEISVIMPVFNSEKYLENAIESVLLQDFRGQFELIVVDDCSTDGSAGIIGRYADAGRIRALRTEKNGGYPEAMNLGLSQAQGRYVSRMDADDVWHPSLLTMEHDAHEQSSEIAFVSCKRFWLTLSGKPYHKLTKTEGDYVFETWEDLIDRKRSFTDVGTLFLKERSQSIGGYNTYQRSGMDVDHWLRIMELTGKPCMTLTMPLVGKRLVPDSIIFQTQTTKTNEIGRELALYRRQNGLPPDHRPDESWLMQQRSKHKALSSDVKRVSFIMDVGMINLSMGDLRGFMAFARVAFPRNPLGTLKFIAAWLIRRKHVRYKAGLPKL